MTFEKMLDEIGIQYAEVEFSGAVSPPYMAYIPSSEMICADSTDVFENETIRLELYRSRKDKASEKAVENVLDSHGIAYSKERVWIGGDQRVYQVAYSFDFNLDEDEQ
jgi:hypothetical protein